MQGDVANQNIQVTRAVEDERPILRHLMELYQYDFSEYDQADIGPVGLYDYPYLDHYWVEDSRIPYLVRVNSQLAGFVLVSRTNYLSGQKDAWVMSEFFIMRKYRHQGVGEHVASWVFNHHPGDWQVAEISENQVAVTFWRKVIARYTHNDYEEHFLDNPRWCGPVQSFVVVSPQLTNK
ncbi:MAG: GNAT family N-acetyltransferase [Acidobacteriaceae bacterium]